MWMLAGLASIGENRSPLSRGDAFMQALWPMAVAATPGILIALIGWAFSRGPKEVSERRRPPRWSWLWVPVALAAWLGAAWYMSSFTATPEVSKAPPAGGRELTLREQSDFRKARGPGVDRGAAQDRAAHPVPTADLRRAERRLEARLNKQNPGHTAEAACQRIYKWNISCAVELVDELGQGQLSTVNGRYVPQSRTVSFRPS